MTDIAGMGWHRMEILRMCCDNLFNLALVLTGPCQLLLSVAARGPRQLDSGDPELLAAVTAAV